MKPARKPGPLRRFLTWLRPPPAPKDDLQRARDLLAALDAGGVPLNPARINQIARSLGLEVSARAPMDQTIARIRAAVARQPR